MIRTHRVRIEMTEVYVLDVEINTDDYLVEIDPDDPTEIGTAAVRALDELDEDDTAAAYEQRSFKIEDFHTGRPLPVDEREV